MTDLPHTDVHRHPWSPALLAALECRSDAAGDAEPLLDAWRVLRGTTPQDDEALLRANPARLLG